MLTDEQQRQRESFLQQSRQLGMQERLQLAEQIADAQVRAEILSRLHAQASETLADEQVDLQPKPTLGTKLKSGHMLGHFEIIKPIGRGGMGEVYQALDTRLGRQVAIKLLPAEFTSDETRVRRFEQEAKAASALNHPNIVTIFDIGEADTGRFIAMELIEGSTLREMIGATLIPDAAASIGIQVAKALAVAHHSGIVHRDIKPENIMIRADGYAKVLDFGIARLGAGSHASAAGVETLTESGSVVGTVAYMSPEQARGEAVTAASDIFSLGVVFYEMATSRHPFRAANALGLLHAIASQMPTPPSAVNASISPELEQLIGHMLQKDPQSRPTAADVALALGRIVGHAGSGSHPPPVSPPVSPPGTLPAPGAILSATRSRISPLPKSTVGRAKERSALRAHAAAAASGRAILLGVSGEPGIGKTTLVEDFLGELASGGWSIARGRCSERLAGTEAYLPLLEALESLIHASDPSLARLLKQVAPTWSAELVPLSSSEARLPVNQVRAASQERMKRELATFLAELSRLQPLALLLEDLHWADTATIDMLSFLAARFDGLAMLIVATYRPSDLLLAKHPFLHIKPDLQARGLCHEVPLDFLLETEIAEYLSLEFPNHQFPADLPALIHLKTEGSPLFMADLVRYLRQRGVIAQTNGLWTLAQALPEIEKELPESVRGMIERKIGQIEEEDRRLLMAASVQGYQFDSAVVTHVLRIEAEHVEESLERLERVFAFVRLVSEHELPNKTFTLTYRFVHVLYQNALYNSLRPTRKVALSREVAQTLETFYRDQRGTVANELATLWEAAREYAAAGENYRIAAQHASKVFATREAVQLARRGLEMVEKLEDGRDRQQLELSLQIALANALIATRGYGVEEVALAYSRAQQLCQQLGNTPYLLPALWGVNALHLMRANYRQVMKPGEEFLSLVVQERNPAIVIAHRVLGQAFLFMGQLAPAREQFQQIVSLYNPEQHRPLTWLYAQEPGMAGHALLGLTMWLLGYPDQARLHSRESLRLGREVPQPNSQVNALFWGTVHAQFRREWTQVRELAETGIALAGEHGLGFWLATGALSRGLAIAHQGQPAEGIDQMRRGLAGVRAAGSNIMRTSALCFLAEAYGRAGQVTEALATVVEAQSLVEQTEERFWAAELCRVRGELLLASGAETSEIEMWFETAVQIAQQQQAKSLELRAATSLARLLHRQGNQDQARQRLSGILDWFTEGFDSPDLVDAQTVFADLTGQPGPPHG